MTALCKTVMDALAAGVACEETDLGARVLTHCLYPSFEPVSVYVVKIGDGFVAHDGGECRSAAWMHGRDPKLISKCMLSAASLYGIRVENNQIACHVPGPEWLRSAILSVANAASAAAGEAVAKQARSATDRLYDRVYDEIIPHFGRDKIEERPKRRGESGREYEFDFAVTRNGRSVVIDVVTPFAASISSKYRALSDAQLYRRGGAFAVHDRPLEKEDEALLSKVADVVPISSLVAGLERELEAA